MIETLSFSEDVFKKMNPREDQGLVKSRRTWKKQMGSAWNDQAVGLGASASPPEKANLCRP